MSATLPPQTSIYDLIDTYHDLLTDEVAEEADYLLRKRLKERGLYFGDRPLTIVLRPYFYTSDDWEYITNGMEAVLSAFKKAHEACCENDDYRKQLLLDDYEEELYTIDANAPLPWTSSRIDSFFVTEERSLKIVEYNAETPAGIGYNDILAEVFEELEPMKQFHKKVNMNPMRSLDVLTDALTKAYYEWGGRDKPQIGILDWSDVPTLNEHMITRDYFEANGYKAILADPRSLDYVDGKLMAGDFHITMIYKRVLYSELIDRMGTKNAVLNAVKDKAVFITNSPSAKLMSKKASLAFLSDEKNAHLFDATELGAIADHIPWTRVVADRKTTYAGQAVDLVEFVADNRDRFVLKPNDDYGGAGVVLGWECSADGWEATLKQALERPYVVQEKVKLVERKFPSWINGELSINKRYVDTDPYAFNGQTIYGCLTRLSPLALLNVTAGGGSIVPTYILHP